MSEAEATEAAVIIPKESALAVLTDQEKFDAFYERVAETVRGVPVDLTTAAGRRAVAALAFKVVKSKTAILAAAEELTADARDQIKKVNASKADIETKLNGLRDEVRKPLTDWEAAEEDKVARARAAKNSLTSDSIVMADMSSDLIRERIETLKGYEFTADQFGEEVPILSSLRDIAVKALESGLERALKAEADARELAELRAQQAERDRLEAEREAQEEAARLEREAEEERLRLEQEEADRVEQERLRREQEETDRLETAEAEKRAAADQARLDAEREAEERREQERLDHQAALDEAETKRLAAEAEATRLREERAEEERVAQVQRDADAARAKDREHKSKVMAAAKVAIMAVLAESAPGDLIEGHDERLAISIVRAIVAGEIPAVTLAF